MPIQQNQLLEAQIRSMRLSAPRALDYHYKNYCDAHKRIQFDWKNGEKIDAADHVRRLSVVRFELIAYLNWLGRIFHFVENMKRNGWSDLVFTNDFKIFRDKWASHRSIDDPQNEDDFLHLQILLNLDTSQTFNSRGEYELVLLVDNKQISFNLFERHDDILSELKKIFSDLSEGQLRKPCAD